METLIDKIVKITDAKYSNGKTAKANGSLLWFTENNKKLSTFYDAAGKAVRAMYHIYINGTEYSFVHHIGTETAYMYRSNTKVSPPVIHVKFKQCK